MNVQEQFRYACKDDNLELAQQLLKDNPTIDISYDNEFAFQCACKYGHLPVAQWLLEVKPDINISALNEFAFQIACENGHLEVAQWLLIVKPTINIFAFDHYAFKMACKNGHLEVAQWLLQVKPFKYSITIKNNKIMYWKIYTNYIENILFLLYSLINKGYANELHADLLTNISKYL